MHIIYQYVVNVKAVHPFKAVTIYNANFKLKKIRTVQNIPKTPIQ